MAEIFNRHKQDHLIGFGHYAEDSEQTSFVASL